MERREQYDPEDIESLLYERSFDELLEEERAYVLRHLSGRAEYEAMRTLLLELRTNDAQAPPLEPLPSVRANVMEAFRAQRQPQWRIWLNSIGGVLVASCTGLCVTGAIDRGGRMVHPGRWSIHRERTGRAEGTGSPGGTFDRA
jgi:hypothetical protein